LNKIRSALGTREPVPPPVRDESGKASSSPVVQHLCPMESDGASASLLGWHLVVVLRIWLEQSCQTKCALVTQAWGFSEKPAGISCQ